MLSGTLCVVFGEAPAAITIGRPDAKEEPDLKLEGLGMSTSHAMVSLDGEDKLVVTAMPGALVYHNGNDHFNQIDET